MSDAVTVSVVLPVHRGARYVEEQLTSILDQVPAPAEVLVGDDGSDDDSVGIIRRVAAGSPSVRIDAHENLGLRGNLSLLLSAATGDIVLLADQDDRWRPGKIQSMLQAFAASPRARAVFSNGELIDADGQPLGRSLWDAVDLSERVVAAVSGDRVFDLLLRGNIIVGAGLGFRRELLEAALPLPEAGMHDHWLALLAAADGGLLLLDRALIDYRVHDGNTLGLLSRSPISAWNQRARLIDPRADEAKFFEAASERLVASGLDLSSDVLVNLRDRAAFARWRGSLAHRPFRRLPEVVRAAAGGRYRRYSRRPWRSIAYDLVSA